MLVVDRATGHIQHRRFTDLLGLLPPACGSPRPCPPRRAHHPGAAGTLLPEALEAHRGAVPVVDSLEVPGLSGAGMGVTDLRAVRHI